MSEERIKERCKREDIALKIVKGFLEKDCYTDTELEYSLKTLLELYNKQKEEIQQKDITIEALKNAIGNILQWQKWCKEIKGGKTIHINLIEKRDKYWQDKIKDIIKCLDHEPYTAFDAYGELLYDTEIDIKQKLNELLEEK